MGTQTSSALYLYAFIPTDQDIIFDAEGAGDPDEVYTITHDGLAAVVSASALPNYHGLSRSQVVQYLVAHQRVIETVMQSFPLLPVKFGTVLADEAQVRCLLAQGYTLFNHALQQFTGRVQMEVVVLWDVATVFHEITQEETVVRMRTQIGNRPPEETMPERVELGRIVQESLFGHRADLTQMILPTLREVALDITSNPLMDDNMVTNLALLVDEPGRQALEKRIDQMDAAFTRGDCRAPGNSPLTFRFVGPLPPYNFATVEAASAPYEAVEAARQLLGLPEVTTAYEMKHAYYDQAAHLHPDQNPNLAGGEEQMTALSQAYNLLRRYNAAREMVGDTTCSFTPQAVQQTMLIDIVRQEA